MTEQAKGLRRTDDGDPFNAGFNAALDEVEPEVARLREGLSAVALEYSTKFFDQGAEIAHLRAQLDELLVALKALTADISDSQVLKDNVNLARFAYACAVIAAVEDCR